MMRAHTYALALLTLLVLAPSEAAALVPMSSAALMEEAVTITEVTVTELTADRVVARVDIAFRGEARELRFPRREVHGMSAEPRPVPYTVGQRLIVFAGADGQPLGLLGESELFVDGDRICSRHLRVGEEQRQQVLGATMYAHCIGAEEFRGRLRQATAIQRPHNRRSLQRRQAYYRAVEAILTPSAPE